MNETTRVHGSEEACQVLRRTSWDESDRAVSSWPNCTELRGGDR